MISEAINNYLSENKLTHFNLKAVFFDMDGVLFDSMIFHAGSWISAMNDINIPFTEHEAYMNEGRTGHSTIDGAFQKVHKRNATDTEKQQIYSSKSKYFETYGASPVMPSAQELLAKIKKQGLEIFLVTGSGQLSLLDSLQIHFPAIFSKERMVTAYDVSQGKPSPEPYLTALHKSGHNRNEVLVVENAPLGVESAHQAGLFTIAVNTGPLPDDVLWHSGADVVLDSVASLFQNWDKLMSTVRE
ncbi:MAG: beta-phosphoglucomutase [Porphyromonadaceae bacterium CG2_30_38_12]|nr:MAG: beta-phosphoglucomutase [Porphyromonadaceae bacterium CG2_30_38_12]